MKGATRCAERLKKFFGTLRNKLGKVDPPDHSDPITQLILGVLSRDVPESKARAALDRVRAEVVDYNEVRVIPSGELADILGDSYPDARAKADDLGRALNHIFAAEHDVTLEQLRSLNKKEAAAYLEQVDGLEAYTCARIRLFGFGHHAVPLDEAMWALARQAEIVDSKCPLGEAQAFLERQISDGEAPEFFALLQTHAWSELGQQVRKRKVERIESAPMERKSTHMLQEIAPDRGIDLTIRVPAAVLEPEPDAKVTEAPVKARRTTRTRKAAAPKEKSAKSVTKKTKTVRSSKRAAPSRQAKRSAAPKKKGARSSKSVKTT